MSPSIRAAILSPNAARTAIKAMPFMAPRAFFLGSKIAARETGIDQPIPKRRDTEKSFIKPLSYNLRYMDKFWLILLAFLVLPLFKRFRQI